MRKIHRVFALSAWCAAFALGTAARGQQGPTGFDPGPGGFPLGQGGGMGIPMPIGGVDGFATSLLTGSVLGPDAPGDLLKLVRLPAVQQELKLTDAQKLKLKELQEQEARPEADGGGLALGNNEPAPVREADQPAPRAAVGKRSAAQADRKGRGPGRNQARGRPQPGAGGHPGNDSDPAQGGIGQDLGNGFGLEHDLDPMAMIVQIASRLRKAEAEMLKVLEPKQRERLEEIGLQHSGVKAVARTEIGQKINLSTTQANQVQAIASQLQAGQLAMMEQHRDDFLERIGPASPAQVDPRMIQGAVKQAEQASQGLARQAETAINRLLKPAQKEAFQKLQGEPFDLKSALAGKPIRPKPGGGESDARNRRPNDPAEDGGNEAGAPSAGTPRPEAPSPARKLQVPRAKDAGKRPSAIKQP